MKGDGAIESGAGKLDELAGKAAEKGGIGDKVASELVEDAAFLRKLKPSLIAKRAKGELPKNAEPGSVPATTVRRPAAPSGPQHAAKAGKRGPNPFAVVGTAFGIGTLLAKLIDWRGHAHPRR